MYLLCRLWSVASVLWTCCILLVFGWTCLLAAITLAAVGYLGRRDTRKNHVKCGRQTLFSIEGSSNCDRGAANIVGSSFYQRGIYVLLMLSVNLQYYCWVSGGVFFFPSLTPFHGLFWPSLLTGEFLKVFSAAPLATPTAAQLGIFWSRQPPLKTPSDCHHLQTPSGRLVQGIWLDYQLRVDCRLSLGDCVALRLSQVPLASNISAAAADKNFFFFFNDLISFKTNSTRWNQLPTWRDGGGGAHGCLPPHACVGSERKAPTTQGFPGRSKLMVQHLCY